MISSIKKNIYKKLYRSKVDTPEAHTLKNKFNFINKSPTYYFQKFGNKNKGKIFYVIKIYEKIKEGGGLFSNLLFVLNHLKIVEKLNVIPVIDMENFYNRYNEAKPVKKIKNSWLYYFDKVSRYDLKEVYQSNKVLMNSGFFSKSMSQNFKLDKNLKKVFDKYIKIKKEFINNANEFEKKNFKDNKVLGVHLRGTDRIIMSSHPFPPTIEQMFFLVDSAIKKYNFTKIFLITDQIKYLKFFEKKYGNKLCYRKESFRSNLSKIFHLKVRKNHRFEIGRDNMEEMLILSKLSYLICSISNLSQTAAMLSKNNFKVMEIDNGMNSKSFLIAQFKFYLKSYLPEIFGGFQKKLNIKFKVFK
jgi:hypothetical protein